MKLYQWCELFYRHQEEEQAQEAITGLTQMHLYQASIRKANLLTYANDLLLNRSTFRMIHCLFKLTVMQTVHCFIKMLPISLHYYIL